MIDKHPMLREAMIYLGPGLKALPCKHPKSISVAEICTLNHVVWWECCGTGDEWEEARRWQVR